MKQIAKVLSYLVDVATDAFLHCGTLGHWHRNGDAWCSGPDPAEVRPHRSLLRLHGAHVTNTPGTTVNYKLLPNNSAPYYALYLCTVLHSLANVLNYKSFSVFNFPSTVGNSSVILSCIFKDNTSQGTLSFLFKNCLH